MIIAFFSAIMNAIENIFDKKILNEKGVSYKVYLAVAATVIFLISLLFYKYFWKISPNFFSTKYLLYFLGLIFVSFFYNILFFWAMSKEELCDVEPFVLIDRPVTVILAAGIFSSERSLIPLIFSLIAGFALVISRFEKEHLKMKKTTLGLILFVFLIAFESIFVKLLLPVLSPVALYGIRNGFLAILYWLILRPKINSLNTKNTFLIAGNSFVTFVQYVARFYAIAYIGIVQTSLILLLGPVLALGYSKIFMKENLTLKKAICDVVIVICVIATLILR